MPQEIGAEAIQVLWRLRHNTGNKYFLFLIDLVMHHLKEVEFEQVAKRASERKFDDGLIGLLFADPEDIRGLARLMEKLSFETAPKCDPEVLFGKPNHQTNDHPQE